MMMLMMFNRQFFPWILFCRNTGKKCPKDTEGKKPNGRTKEQNGSKKQ